MKLKRFLLVWALVFSAMLSAGGRKVPFFSSSALKTTPEVLTISSNTLTLTNQSSMALANTSSGAQSLYTIDSAKNSGVIYLGISSGSNALTIHHNTGTASGTVHKIICPGNQNLVITETDSYATLVYNPLSTFWDVVAFTPRGSASQGFGNMYGSILGSNYIFNKAGSGAPEFSYGLSVAGGLTKIWADNAQADLFVSPNHPEYTMAFTQDTDRIFLKKGASGSGYWRPLVENPLDRAKGSLYPDPFFSVSGGDTTFTVEGKKIYSSAYTNLVWDGTYSHPYGQGAWMYDTSNSALMGYPIWFTLEELEDLNLDAGDTISVSALVVGATDGGRILLAGRFFDSASATSWVGSQVGTTSVYADQGVQLLRSEGITIPSGAAGFHTYLYDGSPETDFYVLALWAQKGPRASSSPPARSYRPQRKIESRLIQDYGVTGPKPDELQVSTRLYGVSGASMEISVYPANLHSTQLPRLYNFTGSLGQQQSERWWYEPSGTVTAGSLGLEIQDPHTLEVLDSATYQVDVVTNTDAAAATVQLLCIGDSLTAAGTYTQRLLDLSTANASAVQLTLTGTQGTGLNQHEGQGGWTAERYHSPGATWFASNPFVRTSADEFDAQWYLDNEGVTQPEVVFWHLGVNDVYTKTNDADVNTAMDNFLVYMDEMIGVEASATVTSWAEVDPTIKHLIAVPTVPSVSQDAFGDDYGLSYNRARVMRNLQIAGRRIIDHYSGSEASGIFLVPWNAVMDTEHNFPRAASDTYNVHTSDTVERQNDSVHPASSGYLQLGDMLWSALNVLKVRGSI